MKRLFIIHGWEGYPEEAWFPWLKKELEEKDFEVKIPQMPDSESPKLETWLPFLKNLVGSPTSEDYFVGHSTGAITILRFIESLKDNENIGGAVLVGGFALDLSYSGYNNELASFFKYPINWAKISKHCQNFVAINSSNDPWVSLENNQIFVENLGAKGIILPNMEHFSGDDGITELPVVLDSILNFSS